MNRFTETTILKLLSAAMASVCVSLALLNPAEPATFWGFATFYTLFCLTVGE